MKTRVKPHLDASANRRRRVRVWFGEHVVVEYVAEQGESERYAEAMGRRFAGLRVTSEPAACVLVAPPLPDQRMWELVPR